MIEIIFSQEVNQAKASNKPIVALESTIISHGMPYPQNVETANKAEDEIRKYGAIPATIALLNGKLHVGLEKNEIHDFAAAKNVAKISRADLSYNVVSLCNGATTVAATMICAKMVEIEVFATGGIGGVHRDVEISMDVSADLQELARTSVIVVAAGVKAILDISRTLEVLETLGVPVLVYKNDFFPAFWARTSDVPAPIKVNNVADIVATYLAQQKFALPAGLLVANPISAAKAIPWGVIDGYVNTALADAKKNSISGKNVTPYLLQRLNELSKGDTLAANIDLLLNNANLAAEIACSLNSSSYCK